MNHENERELTIQEVQEIFLSHLETMPADLKKAVKYTLNHWSVFHKPKFFLPENFFNVEDMAGEKWSNIEDYENLYQVSNYGRIKTFHNTDGNILKPSVNQNGYLRVNLSKNAQSKSFFIHVLVAKAFIPNPDNKPIVNHKDNNHANNYVDNLEWVTRSENAYHAYSIGVCADKRGTNNQKAKLTPKDVQEIRETLILGDANFGSYALAKKYNVSPSTILRVYHGESYQNI